MAKKACRVAARLNSLPEVPAVLATEFGLNPTESDRIKPEAEGRLLLRFHRPPEWVTFGKRHIRGFYESRQERITV